MAAPGKGTGSDAAAFDLLANEIRMQILHALGEADESISFTALRDRLGLRRGSQFNYHLNKLTGHFLRRSEDGYELSPHGRQVYQAVLSGTVTENPILEPTELDEACYHCGTPIWFDYKDQCGYIYCPGCKGNVQVPEDVLVDRLGSPELAAEMGVKSLHPFPPALVTGRTADEIYRAAVSSFHLEMLSWGVDLCPSCTSVLDSAVELCESHEATGGLCGECGNLQAVMLRIACTNCNYTKYGLFSYRLFAHSAMLDFITDHGLNPIAPSSPEAFWGHFTPYDEDIVSAEPFEARFTFTIDDGAITFTVDDDLAVADVAVSP